MSIPSPSSPSPPLLHHHPIYLSLLNSHLKLYKAVLLPQQPPQTATEEGKEAEGREAVHSDQSMIKKDGEKETIGDVYNASPPPPPLPFHSLPILLLPSAPSLASTSMTARVIESHLLTPAPLINHFINILGQRIEIRNNKLIWSLEDGGKCYRDILSEDVIQLDALNRCRVISIHHPLSAGNLQEEKKSAGMNYSLKEVRSIVEGWICHSPLFEYQLDLQISRMERTFVLIPGFESEISKKYISISRELVGEHLLSGAVIKEINLSIKSPSQLPPPPLIPSADKKEALEFILECFLYSHCHMLLWTHLVESQEGREKKVREFIDRISSSSSSRNNSINHEGLLGWLELNPQLIKTSEHPPLSQGLFSASASRRLSKSNLYKSNFRIDRAASEGLLAALEGGCVVKLRELDHLALPHEKLEVVCEVVRGIEDIVSKYFKKRDPESPCTSESFEYIKVMTFIVCILISNVKNIISHAYHMAMFVSNREVKQDRAGVDDDINNKTGINSYRFVSGGREKSEGPSTIGSEYISSFHIYIYSLNAMLSHQQ